MAAKRESEKDWLWKKEKPLDNDGYECFPYEGCLICDALSVLARLPKPVLEPVHTNRLALNTVVMNRHTVSPAGKKERVF